MLCWCCQCIPHSTAVSTQGPPSTAQPPRRPPALPRTAPKGSPWVRDSARSQGEKEGLGEISQQILSGDATGTSVVPPCPEPPRAAFGAADLRREQRVEARRGTQSSQCCSGARGASLPHLRHPCSHSAPASSTSRHPAPRPAAADLQEGGCTASQDSSMCRRPEGTAQLRVCSCCLRSRPHARLAAALCPLP